MKLFALLAFLPLSGLADPSQYVPWGMQMLQAKKYDEAMKYFGGAIKADPNNAAAYKGMGYACVYKNDKACAIQNLSRALELNPADTQLKQYVASLGGSPAPSASEIAYQSGVKYMQSKQYPYAAYYFNQASLADPASAKAWQGLGNAFFAQGNKAKAIDAWDKAVALDPANTKLAAFVASLKTPEPQAAPAATVNEAEATPKKSDFNPWVMSGSVAALGAVMLFLF